MENQKKRGIFSTILMSIFGFWVGGFLWIGRPRFALLAFILPVVWILAIMLSDLGYFFLFVEHEWALWLVSAAVIGLTLYLRPPFKPSFWYSKWYMALLVGWLSAAVTAVPIRTFLYQPFKVPSTAMAPTLVAGDQFFAAKFAYGYSRYSFPFGFVPISRRLRKADPQLGDVAVFRHPFNPQLDYVERVVGLPGDTVQMTNGILSINGTPVQREALEPIEDTLLAESDGPVKAYRETLPNGVTYVTIDLVENGAGDDTALFRVPDGHFFAMGDNRDNSNDSRFALGFVPMDNLIGRADRIFAQSEGKDFWERRHLRTAASTASAPK